MEDFAAMQAKAKQLVQIYKPTHISTMASATLLAHTVPENKPTSTPPQPQINQHQLAPTNLTPQEEQASGNSNDYRGNYRGWGRGRDRGSRGRGGGRNPDTRDDRTVEEIGENINRAIMTIEDKVKKTLLGDVGKTGTITMIIGTKVGTVKAMVEARNGIEDEVKVMGIEVGVADGTRMTNTLPQDMSQAHIIKIRTTTDRRLWDIKPHTQQGHLNTQFTPHSNSSNIQCHAHQHGHNKLLTFANYVKTLDILIINASSQANL